MRWQGILNNEIEEEYGHKGKGKEIMSKKR
jgi:hypothetical protein